ncbi:hypothetical protein [Salininema proteolyticum]|uniref:Protein kinase domain-containing protein n=1 Tax=Salininema proteolyticum TaxID=1607685 RepID=A0ABV8U155_9ACTN
MSRLRNGKVRPTEEKVDRTLERLFREGLEEVGADSEKLRDEIIAELQLRTEDFERAARRHSAEFADLAEALGILGSDLHEGIADIDRRTRRIESGQERRFHDLSAQIASIERRLEETDEVPRTSARDIAPSHLQAESVSAGPVEWAGGDLVRINGTEYMLLAEQCEVRPYRDGSGREKLALATCVTAPPNTRADFVWIHRVERLGRSAVHDTVVEGLRRRYRLLRRHAQNRVVPDYVDGAADENGATLVLAWPTDDGGGPATTLERRWTEVLPAWNPAEARHWLSRLGDLASGMADIHKTGDASEGLAPSRITVGRRDRFLLRDVGPSLWTKPRSQVDGRPVDVLAICRTAAAIASGSGFDSPARPPLAVRQAVANRTSIAAWEEGLGPDATSRPSMKEVAESLRRL